MALTRRRFLERSLYWGLGAVAVGGASVPVIFDRRRRVAAGEPIDLAIEEALVEMVDLRPVYHWVFSDPEHGPSLPGPTLVVEEGHTVAVRVTNRLSGPHAFAVPGVVDSGPIPPGQTRTVHFRAPLGGTYLYLDPLNAPVNRVLGLHGVMIVHPPSFLNTPFGAPTAAVQDLFDDLGRAAHFPGDPWRPERSWTWHFHAVDPVKNDAVEELPPGAEPDREAFLDGYLPQYFLISGKSGYFSSHDPKIFPHGNIGQPALIRCVNTGLAVNSPHIHGNHVYQVSRNGVVQENPFFLDTWTVGPLERVDLLHPFEVPPDADPWPPSDLREFPMPLTMHCHTEMSQTAAGGNYPQGAVTDWEITSPRVGGPEPSEEEFPFFRGMDPGLFK